MRNHTDPNALLDDLDPESLQARLDDLRRQLNALRILLRAARARRKLRGIQEVNKTSPTISESGET